MDVNAVALFDGMAFCIWRMAKKFNSEGRAISNGTSSKGMLEILKQNVTADKNGLYRSLVSQCGINRVGKTINEILDSALRLLEDTIDIDGDQLSLR